MRRLNDQVIFHPHPHLQHPFSTLYFLKNLCPFLFWSNVDVSIKFYIFYIFYIHQFFHSSSIGLHKFSDSKYTLFKYFSTYFNLFSLSLSLSLSLFLHHWSNCYFVYSGSSLTLNCRVVYNESKVNFPAGTTKEKEREGNGSHASIYALRWNSLWMKFSVAV